MCSKKKDMTSNPVGLAVIAMWKLCKRIIQRKNKLISLAILTSIFNNSPASCVIFVPLKTEMLLFYFPILTQGQLEKWNGNLAITLKWWLGTNNRLYWIWSLSCSSGVTERHEKIWIHLAKAIKLQYKWRGYRFYIP